MTDDIVRGTGRFYLLCERARRHAGFSAKLHCRACALGPCRDNMHRTEEEMNAAMGVRFGPPVEYTIPNRLHGAAINAEGDAI